MNRYRMPSCRCISINNTISIRVICFFFLLFLLGSCSRPDNNIIDAAKENKSKSIEHALGSGTNVDSSDDKGFTPLMWAAVSGHAGIVKLLLEKGARVNARNKNGETALSLVSYKGNEDI